MEKVRMRYPAQSCHETRRQRKQREALTAAAAREAAHIEQFGTSPVKATEEPLYAVEVRTGHRRLTMPFEVFQGADYGQLCQYLGLRPSKPNHDAHGRRRRARAGR